MSRRLRKYTSKNVVVVNENSIILKSFLNNTWKTHAKFNFFNDLSVKHRKNLKQILETIDLSLFSGDLDIRSSAIIDHDEMLKNFEYVLDHDSDNVVMKFVILIVLPKVRFFNEYIIDEYLKSNLIEQSNKPLVNIFKYFYVSKTDVSYADPKEFIRNHQLNIFFANYKSIKVYNELPKNCFLKALSDDNWRLECDDYLKKMHDYMYFYDEHNKELYDWSFQNRSDLIKIALEGFENVSVCELTAFLALTDFDNKLNECSDKSSEELLYTDDLPILLSFIERFKIDYSVFDNDSFSLTFEKNFQILSPTDERDQYYKAIQYNVVNGKYNFYMFLFALMHCDTDKFSQFCDFIIKNKYFQGTEDIAYVRDNLEMLEEWSNHNSEISIIPFHLLANLM